jgi:hydrogenase-4 membrane subunit HyfE
MIIKSILSCLIVILCVLEIIFLKGRLHYDLKIITVLFKMLTIVLFTFFLIEGKKIIILICTRWSDNPLNLIKGENR